MSDLSKRHRLIAYFSISFLCVVLLGLLLNRPEASQAQHKDCLNGERYAVLAEMSRYQVIQQDPKTFQGFHPLMYIVTHDSGVCSIINPLHEDGNERPFSHYIDREIAISLWEQIYQSDIDQVGGLDEYNTVIRKRDLEPGETVIVHIDNYQAMENLGVNIPDFYETYSQELPSSEGRNFYD